jgi:hypothetical protein
MNTKQIFITLVATLFLVVSIGGAQAATTVKGSKSNSDNISSPSTGGNDTSSSDATTVNTTRSNTFRGKGPVPKTNSINLNSSRSN